MLQKKEYQQQLKKPIVENQTSGKTKTNATKEEIPTTPTKTNATKEEIPTTTKLQKLMLQKKISNTYKN